MMLNPQQNAVANCNSSRSIVLAGAGTGKTASAVHWIAKQIKNGTYERNILMVTFTKKAAAQMRDRLIALIGNNGKYVNIGTYHSIASRLMRMDPVGFGLKDKNFTILDSSDALGLMRGAFRITGYKSKSPLTAGVLIKAVSYACNTMQPLWEVLDGFGLKGDEQAVKVIVEHYKLLKQQANAVDYDDLLTLLLERLKTDISYAKKLRGMFQCVLVDEFQDNNNLNYAIIQALNPDKLMVIGDKNQSIYAFRGAYAGLVETYIQTYEDVELLKLEENYRSGQEILDVANQVISSAALALVLKSGIGHSSSIKTKVLNHVKAEAVYGCEVIRNFLGKYDCNEIAILCRSGRAMLPLEFLLRRNHIDYKKYGGVALTDSSEIKDFLAILRILNNPKDSVAIMRALCLFPGIGETFASRFAGLSNTNPNQIPMELGEKDWPPRAKELKGWIDKLEKETEDLGVLGKLLYDLIAPFILTHYPEDYADRLHALQEVVGIMEDEQKEGNNLSDFLEVFVLDKGFEKEHPPTHITLSTIHSAKGLEWDAVLVFNASAESLPSKMSKTRDELEEERRLAYVAITRARKALVITANYEQGGLTPFLEES